MIAIIDVSGNNLTSMTNALGRIGFDSILTHDAYQIRQASHVILPGVGTAGFGMNALKQKGLIPVLTSLKQPLLGVCLGMQLLLEYSEEGEVDCLGLIPGRAELMEKSAEFPVPHMGWNQLHWNQKSTLQTGLSEKDYVYFVHSYALNNKEHCLAQCTYNASFAAIIQKDNVYGMQFHPEKSGETGMRLLENFCRLELS